MASNNGFTTGPPLAFVLVLLVDKMLDSVGDLLVWDEVASDMFQCCRPSGDA